MSQIIKKEVGDRQECIYWVSGIEAGRFSKGSLSLVSAARLKQRQQHRGQANSDRTSTAAVTASFTGTLIGPLMLLEKEVKAMEMVSVPFSWRVIISLRILCLFMNHSLILSVLLEGALFIVTLAPPPPSQLSLFLSTTWFVSLHCCCCLSFFLTQSIPPFFFLFNFLITNEHMKKANGVLLFNATFSPHRTKTVVFEMLARNIKCICFQPIFFPTAKLRKLEKHMQIIQNKRTFELLSLSYRSILSLFKLFHNCIFCFLLIYTFNGYFLITPFYCLKAGDCNLRLWEHAAL